MPSALRSLRQEQRELAAGLRAEHRSWVEIAAAFSDRYGLNVRAALRMVRDWSQRDAAEQWNSRWPADPKTFKNFSYWELWPGPTGYAPSLDVLGRLAELYECSIADLVSDCANFRPADSAYSDNLKLAQVSVAATLGSSQLSDQSEIPDVHELISRLKMIDVHELARLTTAWSERLGTTTSRRTLLLKLSAGLSLAAASPALVGDETADPLEQMTGPSDGFAGIWHSRYVYPSTGREGEFIGEHYVVIRQHANRLIGQSLPHSTGSQLRIELAVDAPVATGSWRETTSPDGYYKGATYHGTLQLVVDPSGRRMRGMWLGFGQDFTVNSGQWDLTWEDASTSKNVRRSYHDKV
jgi:hypothetical protein